MHPRSFRLIPVTAAIVLLLLLSQLVFAADTDIVLSEIMFDAASSEATGEWVEIYNTGTTSVDIEGWTIEDNNSSVSITSSKCPSNSCVIPAGDAWIIAEDSSGLQTEFDDYTNPSGQSVDTSRTIFLGSDIGSGLNNTGDRVILRNDANQPVDCVAYDGFSPDCTGLPYVAGGDGANTTANGGDGQSIANIGGTWQDHQVNASPYDEINTGSGGSPTAVLLSSTTVEANHVSTILNVLIGLAGVTVLSISVHVRRRE